MGEKLSEAQRRRTDAAMLESLAGAFRVLNDGGPLVCPFNFEDVSLLLDRAAELIKPGPIAALSRHGEGE